MAWSFYKSVNSYPACGGTEAGFTGFVTNNSGGDADVYAHAKSDGSDIRVSLDGGSTFVSDSGKGQLQYFYKSGGKAYFLYAFNYGATTSAPTATLWYGNASASSADSTGAWDGNTQLAFSPINSAGSANPQDNSASPVTVTNHTTGVTTGPTGNADAASFDGSSWLDCSNASKVNPPAMTLRAWITADARSAYSGIIVRSDGSSSYGLYVNPTHYLGEYLSTSGSGAWYDPGSHTISGSWQQVCMTYDSTNGLIGYVNGSSDGIAAASGTVKSFTATTAIGEDPGTSGRNWAGSIALVRIDSVARSANWIKLEYDTIHGWGAGATISLGSEQSAGGTAYTLTGLSGSFSLTGTAATLKAGLPAASGSFALSGTAAILRVGIPAASGSFSLSGIAAGLKVGVAGASGSLALSGTAAGLGAGINAVAGAFTLAGTPATLTPPGGATSAPILYYNSLLQGA